MSTNKVRNITVSVASEVAVLLGGKRKEVSGLKVLSCKYIFNFWSILQVDVLLLACGGRGNGGEGGENNLKEGGKCGKEGVKASVNNREEERGVKEVNKEERGEVRRGQFLKMEAEVRSKELSAVVSCNGNNKVYV